MGSRLRVLSPAFLVAGALLLTHAVLSGSAHLYLVLIVPVVAGGSAELFAGVGLIFLGLFLLPLALGDLELSEEGRGPPGSPAQESGGLVLVGPFPIFFGSWQKVSARRYRLAVALGAALLLLFLAVLVFA